MYNYLFIRSTIIYCHSFPLICKYVAGVSSLRFLQQVGIASDRHTARIRYLQKRSVGVWILRNRIEFDKFTKFSHEGRSNPLHVLCGSELLQSCPQILSKLFSTLSLSLVILSWSCTPAKHLPKQTIMNDALCDLTTIIK